MEDNEFVQGRVVFYQGVRVRLEEPGDVGRGKGTAKGAGYGEHQNRVPDGREHDEEYGVGRFRDEGIRAPGGDEGPRRCSAPSGG